VSSQKRKLSNGNTKENQKKTPEVFTPSKKVKTEQPATPKTPLQQKENKSPKVSDSCSPPVNVHNVVILVGVRNFVIFDEITFQRILLRKNKIRKIPAVR